MRIIALTLAALIGAAALPGVASAQTAASNALSGSLILTLQGRTPPAG